MIELIAFLGNPGPEYQNNRHNAGRLLAAVLPFALSWQKKYKGLYAGLDSRALKPPSSPVDGPDGLKLPALPPRLHFLMPETYMNLSGESVKAAASFFKIPPEKILVIHDELELPLGVAAFKFSGGLGGHNGLRSMKSCFGTADFWRLRIGIGRPNHDNISGWVLSDFGNPEKPVLDQVLEACASALTRSLLEGPEALLPEWNKKKIG
ncbi:aminoacyl-tRNA hydrolase [Treponema primitia ZAS-2]|uniref:Peptidyl-tRNA hydrolase n=1 Tax=Treponema primitia (strain ATCC BAA-887 / DSM 12427 / ZAS-2) TaxID=545694 RepID=F5YKG7_TREPZ|nr:aminoacyl-tRNA hydrolase [Treponema primitia]AEF84791.1 aminoacyl-tRNA hydrolase [Treponema primitia ZAS-2]